MTDHSQKILERVRALLAKAESTAAEFPAEADAFRAKADQLMTEHAISIWAVEDAQRGVERRATPTRRDFDRSWRHSKFHTELVNMFQALARHCRCVVGYRGQTGSVMPVYGLPSDLSYLDALYTSLSLEVAKNLQPPVDPDGDLGREVFKQRQAGIAWPEITRKVVAAGLVTLTQGEFKKLLARDYSGRLEGMDREDLTWDDIVNVEYWSMGVREDDARTSIKNRLANANRRYVRDHDLQGERNYVKPEVYQRSFIMGFAEEIKRRIYAMSSATYDASANASGMEVAIRDIRAAALDVYDAEFPPPPPLTPEEEEALRKQIAKLPAVRTREVVVDYGSMAAGRAKARDVSLSNNPNRRTGSGSKPELPGS